MPKQFWNTSGVGKRLSISYVSVYRLFITIGTGTLRCPKPSPFAMPAPRRRSLLPSRQEGSRERSTGPALSIAIAIAAPILSGCGTDIGTAGASLVESAENSANTETDAWILATAPLRRAIQAASEGGSPLPDSADGSVPSRETRKALAIDFEALAASLNLYRGLIVTSYAAGLATGSPQTGHHACAQRSYFEAMIVAEGRVKILNDCASSVAPGYAVTGVAVESGEMGRYSGLRGEGDALGVPTTISFRSGQLRGLAQTGDEANTPRVIATLSEAFVVFSTHSGYAIRDASAMGVESDSVDTVGADASFACCMQICRSRDQRPRKPHRAMANERRTAGQRPRDHEHARGRQEPRQVRVPKHWTDCRPGAREPRARTGFCHDVVGRTRPASDDRGNVEMSYFPAHGVATPPFTDSRDCLPEKHATTRDRDQPWIR